ncbi:hypothetical protein D3261_13670 [Halococcus sp. IIIV-5B]|nr:hypothetical protein D3261_13670 [Halococcus sp. IIIV-5B]
MANIRIDRDRPFVLVVRTAVLGDRHGFGDPLSFRLSKQEAGTAPDTPDSNAKRARSVPLK